MKIFYLLLILCLASCVQEKYEYKEILKIFFEECEDTIGKKASSQTAYEKRLDKNHQNSPEISVTYIPNNGIVETCNITFTFSDFLETKQYYNELHDFITNDWDFVKTISKYKRPTGEIYTKNGIYLEIYEPVYFSIPISFSNSIDSYQDFNQPDMIYDLNKYIIKNY